ncbi:MAG: hypothetical protein Q4P71_08695 [Actinomycetaceae bacterium]|nr:hypothetical protein [Actinomycetaceae bacterium]
MSVMPGEINLILSKDLFDWKVVANVLLTMKGTLMDDVNSEIASTRLAEARKLSEQVKARSGWPQAVGALGVGMPASLFLFMYPEGSIWQGMIPVLFWMIVSISLLARYGRTAKYRFQYRWMAFMLVWLFTWNVGILNPFPYARIISGCVITIATIVSAVVELER